VKGPSRLYVPHGEKAVFEGDRSLSSVSHSIDAEGALRVRRRLVRGFTCVFDLHGSSAYGFSGDRVHHRTLDRLAKERGSEE